MTGYLEARNLERKIPTYSRHRNKSTVQSSLLACHADINTYTYTPTSVNSLKQQIKKVRNKYAHTYTFTYECT